MTNDFIIDATAEDFQKEVIEESHRRLVVVDFWAAWCGPCRTLGPILEALATEDEGSWRLAKVDVDQHPALAQAFQVQGIPSVKAVRDGALVDEFVGALPENQIRAWLRNLVPGEEAGILAAARSFEEAGEVEKAKAAYAEILDEESRQGDALYAMARIEAAEGERERAERHLDMILPDDGSRLEKEIAALRLELAGGGVEEAEKLVRKNPDDLDAKVALGRALAASALYEEALQTLLDVVRRSPREGAGEDARLAMLDVFHAAGARSDLSDKYRALLATELYK